MAAIFSGAADSSKKNEKQPTYLIQYKFPNPLIKYTGSFLDVKDLVIFSRTAKFALNALKDDMAVRKLVAHVFSAKPEILGEWFSKQKDKANMILAKTHFLEGYQSTKIVKYLDLDGRTQVQPREKPLFVCFRKWRNVSALQAAAFCGDKPFLLKLLSQLLVKDKEIVEEYRIAAIQQLEAVKRCVSDQTIILDALTAIVEMESKDTDAATQAAAKFRFEQMQQSEEFQRLITNPSQIEEATFANMSPKDDSLPSCHLGVPDSKTKAENREALPCTPVKYADEAEFLESLLNLLKAYINYYIQYPKLVDNYKWDEADKLWEIIGECHKRLSESNKQVMCDDNPFSLSPPPKFDSEPKRGPCHYWNGDLLDLDGFGLGTGYGLYKSTTPAGCASFVSRQFQVGMIHFAILIDLASFAHLYKLQRDGLGNIIEQLKTPETAHALIFLDIRASAKCS